MKPTITTIDTPTNPALAPARDALAECIRVEVEPAEREWESLEPLTHFAAGEQREALKPRLRRAYDRRDRLAQCVAAEEEVEQIIRSLWPEYLRKREELEVAYQAVLSEVDPPSSAAFVRFYTLNWETETLRAPLFAATRLDSLRAEFDAVAAVERHWRTLHEKRSKLFTHALAPGARPHLRVALSPWANSIGRLSQLRASTKQENNHASV